MDDKFTDLNWSSRGPQQVSTEPRVTTGSPRGPQVTTGPPGLHGAPRSSSWGHQQVIITGPPGHHGAPRSSPRGPRSSSQGPQVVAGPGLLPEEASALALARVAGHQVSQEALSAGRDALPLAPADHVLGAGPRGPRSLAPGQPHGALQELGGPVVQGGGELQVQTLEQGGAGHGL